MKNLLLMRHATAAEKETGQQDADRELTLFGERQAGEMGIKLKSLGLVPELVLCSPAVRTRATVENLMAEVGRNLPLQLEQVIYHGSETEICRLVSDVSDEVDTLLLVGHNPVISFLAAMLQHEGQEPVNFLPATVAHLHFTGMTWEHLRAGTCKLQALYTA